MRDCKMCRKADVVIRGKYGDICTACKTWTMNDYCAEMAQNLAELQHRYREVSNLPGITEEQWELLKKIEWYEKKIDQRYQAMERLAQQAGYIQLPLLN